MKAHPAALLAVGYMFVTNLDSIFVIPLLPVLHGGAPAEVARDVALALSLRLGASLVFSLLLPALAPRAGNGGLLLASSLMKSAAFGCVLALPAPANLWGFALLAGAGTGTLRPVVRAVIAEETPRYAQTLAFQGLFLAMNLAFVIGPLLAEAAMRLDRIAAGVTLVIVLELGAGLAALCFIPRGAASRAQGASEAQGGLNGLKGIEPAVWLLMAQTLLSYLAVGFLIASLVLYAAINPPLAAWRNLLLSAEGLAVIAVQLALLPLFGRMPRGRVHRLVALTAGAGLLLCFTPALPLAFLGLALFALAECLAMPIAQLELSERVEAGRRRGVFALAMVAAALGEIGGAWLAWGVARSEAIALPGAAAGQGAGLLIGGALAVVGWALVRQGEHRGRGIGAVGVLAEERR